MNEAYASHPYHASDRDWPESNCYVDVWIEVLHSMGLEVAPVLGSTLVSDFEGDQWTFFKLHHSDLYQLFGIEVEELTLWRDLVSHLVGQVGRGRIPVVEVDSFYLPDTAGRDYRVAHIKTTVAVEAIDSDRQILRYFHNRSRHELEGRDFRGLLRVEPEAPPAQLMPYCEIAKLDRLVHHDARKLRSISLDLFREHWTRRPGANPVERYAATVQADLEALIASDPEDYDLYAFASIRQCGSGFAFSADYLQWLAGVDPRWADAAESYSEISKLASTLVLKMARIVHSGRMREVSDTLGQMARAWERGAASVDRLLQA
ncbi:MAG: DUF1839 family protein [bacterium]|nr:DUF1839 family protein [bacterium]